MWYRDHGRRFEDDLALWLPIKGEPEAHYEGGSALYYFPSAVALASMTAHRCPRHHNERVYAFNLNRGGVYITFPSGERVYTTTYDVDEQREMKDIDAMTHDEFIAALDQFEEDMDRFSKRLPTWTKAF